MSFENTAKTAAIGGGSAILGSALAGPVLGPAAAGFAADKVTDKESKYTTIGLGVSAFSLFSGMTGGDGQQQVM